MNKWSSTYPGFWNCNKLWKLWYGILISTFQAWVIYNSIKQYIGFKSQYYDPRYGRIGSGNEWNMAPLHFYIFCIIFALALLLLFLYFCVVNMHQYGNNGNYGYSWKYVLNLTTACSSPSAAAAAVGNGNIDVDVDDDDDNNNGAVIHNNDNNNINNSYCQTNCVAVYCKLLKLVKEIWVWDAFLHWIIAVCLLVPLPLMHREQIINEALPPEAVWYSDLHSVMQNFFWLQTPIQKQNHDGLSISLADQANTNKLHYIHRPPSISLEFINFTLASILFTIRISSCFWSFNKPFSIIFSSLVFLNSISWFFLYQSCSILIKGASNLSTVTLVITLLIFHVLLLGPVFGCLMHYGYAQVFISCRSQQQLHLQPQPFKICPILLPIIMLGFILFIIILSLDSILYRLLYSLNTASNLFVVTMVIGCLNLVVLFLTWFSLSIHCKWRFYYQRYPANNSADSIFSMNHYQNQQELTGSVGVRNLGSGGIGVGGMGGMGGGLGGGKSINEFKLLSSSPETIYGCFHCATTSSSVTGTGNIGGGGGVGGGIVSVPISGNINNNNNNNNTMSCSGTASSNSSTAHIPGSDSGLGLNTLAINPISAANIGPINPVVAASSNNYVYLQHHQPIPPTINEDHIGGGGGGGGGFSGYSSNTTLASAVDSNNSMLLAATATLPISRKLVSFSEHNQTPSQQQLYHQHLPSHSHPQHHNHTNYVNNNVAAAIDSYHLKVPDILNLNQSSVSSVHSDSSSLLDEQISGTGSGASSKLLNAAQTVGQLQQHQIQHQHQHQHQHQIQHQQNLNGNNNNNDGEQQQTLCSEV